MNYYGLGCVVFAMMAVSSCAPPKAPPPPVPKVTFARPQLATVTNWDEYPGHLEAVEVVEVRPRVSGYIDSIHFQEGSEVKAGDLLMVIDPRPYQAELEHAHAEFLEAQTRLERNKNEFKRAEGLLVTKAISEEEWDARKKAVFESEAALTAAKASETTARINLDYTQIKSPINGKIGRRLVTVGNVVQGAGMMAGTMVATIVSLEPIYCYFNADEQAYLQYCDNRGSGAAMSCELGLVNEEGFPHKGKVDFFDNTVDAKTGTIRMRAVFDNQDRRLVPGLFARARVPAGPPTQALLVPDAAIGSDQGRKFVFVINKENMIETRALQTGRSHGQSRAVLEGLNPQDRVVVNGLMLVRAGIKVEAQEAK